MTLRHTEKTQAILDAAIAKVPAMPLNARGFINLRRFIPLWMKTRRSIAIELGLDPCDPNLNLGDLLLPLSAAVDDRQSAGSKKPTSGHP